MKEDEIRWDERYQEKKFPETVNELVKTYSNLATTGGKALDVAAGNGRNSLFLVEQGFQVDAVDISKVAVDLIQSRSQAINGIHQDLDEYKPKPGLYDLIININFLNRRLFPHYKRALRKNGILIFNTFLDSHFLDSSSLDAPHPHSNRDHYLQTNELLHSFISLQVLHYSEVDVVWANGQKRKAARLVARKTCGFDCGG